MSDEVEEVGTSAVAPARDVETVPNYGVEQVDVDYKLMLQKFKERALFVDGVRKEAVVRTRPHHWLSRRSKTGTTFSLMSPGAELIRTIAPIGFKNKTRREETWNKEGIGPGYTIYYEADVYLGNERTGLLPVIGSCSSDDDFFSTEHKRLDYKPDNPEHNLALESGEGNLSNDKKTIYIRRRIPANEVTKENIVKSALANLIVNGVTRVLGIRSMSDEQLRDYGIDPDKIPGFEYGSKRGESGKETPAEEQKRVEVKKWLLEINGGDEKKALASLQEMTAFNDFKGCRSWDRVSQKQLPYLHKKAKAAYEQFRGDAAPADQGGAGKKDSRGATGKKPAGKGGQPELL